jgi:hypothetical protein
MDRRVLPQQPPRHLDEWSQREHEIAGDRLFARLIVGFLGGLLLGIAGAGLCMLAFGSASGYAALLCVWVAGIATALVAPDIVRACRWLLIAAGVAILLLVFSSAIISDRLLPGSSGPLQGTDHQNETHILLLGMLLGGLALFSGLWVGRDPKPKPRSVVSDKHTDRDHDSDANAATGKLPILDAGSRGRVLQYGLLAVAFLGLIGLLLWNSRGTSTASVALKETAAVPTLSVAAETIAAPVAAAALPVEEPAAATGAAAPISPSQVRQECMAQIEAARLFLALARTSDSRGDYEVKLSGEIERFRRERPVGPRTLTLIATAMWSRRAVPDPDAGVWSREYSQCERTRTSGTYYVVRGR